MVRELLGSCFRAVDQLLIPDHMLKAMFLKWPIRLTISGLGICSWSAGISSLVKAFGNSTGFSPFRSVTMRSFTMALSTRVRPCIVPTCNVVLVLIASRRVLRRSVRKHPALSLS